MVGKQKRNMSKDKNSVNGLIYAVKFMINNREFMKHLLLNSEEFKEFSAKTDSCEDCQQVETFCETHLEELEETFNVPL